MQDVKYTASLRESSPKIVDSMSTSTATLEFHLRSSPFLTAIWRILDCESCKHQLIKTIEDEGIFFFGAGGCLESSQEALLRDKEDPKLEKL